LAKTAAFALLCIASADAFVTGPASLGFTARTASPLASKGAAVGLRLGNAGVSGLMMQDLDRGNDLTQVGRRNLEDLDGKWSKVCVLGASKGVGLEVTKQLSGMGVEVVALVRREESKKELEAMKGVKAIIGDALEASDVVGALNGCDAAISTLGGDKDSQVVDYKGNMNMIEMLGSSVSPA